MLHVDPLTVRGAATALALEETLQQILAHRTDLQRPALLPAEAELISGFLADARNRAKELRAAGEQLAQLRNSVTRNA